MVKKFVRAALSGWKDTFANPQEAAKIQLQYVKALDPQIVVEEIEILKRVAITPDVQKNGLGYITLERMKNTVDFINKNIEVPGDKLTAEQIYRPGLPAGKADIAVESVRPPRKRGPLFQNSGYRSPLSRGRPL